MLDSLMPEPAPSRIRRHFALVGGLGVLARLLFCARHLLDSLRVKSRHALKALHCLDSRAVHERRFEPRFSRRRGLG